MLPAVYVVITTYKRTVTALETLKALRENLIYSNYGIIIADDGSPSEHLETLLNELQGVPNVYSTNANRKGVGHSKNIALKKAFEMCDIVLLMEDDWRLDTKFDITNDVKTIITYEDVGMIRYGWLTNGIKMSLQGYGLVSYLELEKHSHQYVYSGQVSLRHRRWYDSLGYHAEGLAAGSEEIEYCDRYNHTEKTPKILWRSDVPVLWGPFRDNSTESLNGVQPE